MCLLEELPPIGLLYVTFILSAILSVFTVLGNGLIILVVIKDPLKKLHTPFNYFLVNLAFSDFLVGAFTMPISVYVHYRKMKGYFSDYVSPLLTLSTFISGTASILSLVALTLDRYIAIVYALKYRQFLCWYHCVTVTVLIWVVSLSLPFLYYEIGFNNYLMFFVHSSILTAFLVIVFVYCRVIRHLNKQTSDLRKMKILNATDGDKFTMMRLKREKSVTRALMEILVAFVGLYLPATVLIYIIQFCTACSCDLIYVFRDMEFLFIITNSCVNPFICTIRLKKFRESLLLLFGQKKPNNSPHQSSHADEQINFQSNVKQPMTKVSSHSENHNDLESTRSCS